MHIINPHIMHNITRIFPIECTSGRELRQNDTSFKMFSTALHHVAKKRVNEEKASAEYIAVRGMDK